jgi:hypothetical protein
MLDRFYPELARQPYSQGKNKLVLGRAMQRQPATQKYLRELLATPHDVFSSMADTRRLTRFFEAELKQPKSYAFADSLWDRLKSMAVAPEKRTGFYIKPEILMLRLAVLKGWLLRFYP